MVLRYQRRFLVLVLVAVVVATMPLAVPAEGVRKVPPPWAVCWVTIGTDPQGVVHAAYFYRLWLAKRQAATWAAAGWTGIVVDTC